MSKLHVYRLSGGALVLDLQADAVESGSRVVAPLLPADQGRWQTSRMHPVLLVNGERYRLRTEALGAVKTHQLSRDAIADLSAAHDAVRDALDLLFQGY